MLNYKFQKKYFEWILVILSTPILITIFTIVLILQIIFVQNNIFYKHKRVGKNNKDIYVYKFRTMKLNSNEILKTYLDNNYEARLEWDIKRKLSSDPRVSNYGKFLRKTKLDELPQILNFVYGELSLVGPRPLTTEELKKYFTKEESIKYLSVNPGISGLWQTSKGVNTFEERKNLELYYVDNISFLSDVKIILKTLTKPFKFEN